MGRVRGEMRGEKMKEAQDGKSGSHGENKEGRGG